MQNSQQDYYLLPLTFTDKYCGINQKIGPAIANVPATIEQPLCGEVQTRFCNKPDGTIKRSPERVRGRWRHSNGMIFCGTMRMLKADFDTDPCDQVRDAWLQQVCDAMNDAQAVDNEIVSKGFMSEAEYLKNMNGHGMAGR